MRWVFFAFVLAVGLWLQPLPVVANDLIPCGGEGQPLCQTCHVVQLVSNVVEWLVAVLGIVVVILIVYAGARLVTAGGSAEVKGKVKSILRNIFIGYALILASWFLIDFMMKVLLTEGSTKLGMWNVVQCTDQPKLVGKEFNPGEFDPYIAPVTASGLNAISFTAAEVTANVAVIRGAGSTGQMVAAAAASRGLNAAQTKVFTALVMQESSMCRQKTGPATRYGTAYGCGQMLLSTAKGLDPSATAERLRDDDAYNLSLSARYFSQQLAKYNGDYRRALASYNGGDKANEPSSVCPGQMAWECQKNSGYAQTRNYVSNILSVAGRL